MDGAQILDIVMFAGIAVFLIIKLTKMLGNDSQDNRPDNNPYEKISQQFSTEEKATKKPEHGDSDDMASMENSMTDTQNDQSTDDCSMYDERLQNIITDMKTIDPDFNLAEFLDGAGMAYDMIITAYAKEEIDVLENLISEKIYNDFAAAIQTRDDAGEDMDIMIIGVDTPKLVDIDLDGNVASITVSIISRQTMVVYDTDRNVIEGDASLVEDCVDRWSFERDLTSDNPAWSLSATHHVQ